MSKLKDGYVSLELAKGGFWVTILADDVESVTSADDWEDFGEFRYKTSFIHTVGGHYHRVKGSAEDVHGVLGWR